MSQFLIARRRFIARCGQPMVLNRPLIAMTPASSVPFIGFFSEYSPMQLTGGVQQGDARVLMLADEILAAGWVGPPRRQYQVVISAATWTIQGVTAVMRGAELLGYNLWIRGGKP